MTWLRTVWSRLWAMLSRDRLDREFDEELATHLELLVDECRRGGMSQGDARREAIRRLGRPLALREDYREQRSIPMLDILGQDLRYALRMLRKSPGLAAIVTLSLALGIGANTALFSLVDGLLLRSLPVRDPERLVEVQQAVSLMGITKRGTDFARPVFDYVRTHNQVLSEIVGFNRLDRPDVTIDGAAEPARRVEQVSENFFRDLGIAPVLGRVPEASDGPVAVISHGLWQTRFGAAANVLGRVVTVNDQAHTIIGVAPPRFLGLSIEQAADLWVSTTQAQAQAMIARVKRGVSPTQAQAALQVIFRQLSQADPQLLLWDERMQNRIELLPAGKGLSQLRAQYERPLLALTVLVTLVFLITCTNVGNLLLVRHTARRRELTVRTALGARRSRLVAQYFIESLLLAALGGVLALVFARWGVSLILSMLPLASVPEALTFHADARIFGFAAAASILSALLFGLAPAWRATRVDLSALRASQGGSAPAGTRRLGRSLVACQVGLSVLLLIGAGLFVQTLRNLVRLDVGFNPDQLLQVSLDTRGSGYGPGQVIGLYRLLQDRVAVIPGVRAVSGIRNGIMRGGLSRTSFRSLGPGRMLGPDDVWDSADVGPGFFETMGIPVLRGRTFNADDFARGKTLIVISESFARRYFPNEDPVGQLDGVLIGVVGDSKLASVRREVGPMMYFLTLSNLNRLDALAIRTTGDPDAVTQAVQAEIRRIHPRLLIGVRTMREEIDRTMATERMVATLSAFFSLLGLLLVSIGIFGVASHTVAQRTNELGIRMALGAGRWSVIRESLRDTLVVFGAGLFGGVVVAVVAVRLTASAISELLFGLTASDAANIAGSVILMVAVALAACVLPARRATRIDPLAAIRHE